jgi:hypothetical protein
MSKRRQIFSSAILPFPLVVASRVNGAPPICFVVGVSAFQSVSRGRRGRTEKERGDRENWKI